MAIARRTGMDASKPAWTVVAACPACGGSARHSRGEIAERHYMFGAERVPTPTSGIQVYDCAHCALVYKSPVPDPAFLAGLFERQMGTKWMTPQDYAPEVAALRSQAARADFDLLDVGAAGGELLGACEAAQVAGRRSALDVASYPGLDRSLKGEFIAGFIDDPALSWSGEPYDVVTVFDVMEHLYRPFVAFANLRALVKPGGLVLIETGDVTSAWPARFGARRWWYARLIEHHVFWSRESLEHCAAGHGMEVVQWEQVRHKSRRQLRRSEVARDLAKSALYRLMPDGYARIAGLTGKEGNQPCSPFAKDHFRVFLRRL